MRVLLLSFWLATACGLLAEENLASKITRLSLNQNEPAMIKLGTHGITTLEFPSKIEAIDGYGFSVNPAPDGPDLFQISFNKGTNFLSLKATREGVEGNLTVVLDGKVYSLLCKSVPNPSFVVIFDGGAGKLISNPRELLAKNKAASPGRLLGFLDKIKAFPSLKVSAPEMFQNMDIAEPNSDSSIEGLTITLRRVIRDNSLDSVGFEVELANKGNKDFLYDPDSLGVRIGDEVYAESVSDAAGLVPAGKAQTAFFVVTSSATGNRNDLAVTNKFAVVLRQVTGEMDPHRKVTTEWREPPDSIPTAKSGWQEPPLPVAGDERAPANGEEKAPAKAEVTQKSGGHSPRQKKKAAPTNASNQASNHAGQPANPSKVAKQ